jgi:hypothetical protein
MGQQYKKIKKRRRRLRYIQRLKEGRKQTKTTTKS